MLVGTAKMIRFALSHQLDLLLEFSFDRGLIFVGQLVPDTIERLTRVDVCCHNCMLLVGLQTSERWNFHTRHFPGIVSHKSFAFQVCALVVDLSCDNSVFSVALDDHFTKFPCRSSGPQARY